MPTNDASAPRFTCTRLLRLLASQVAVLALIEGYWRWRAGKWEATSLAVIPVFAWILVAFAHRWYRLMQQQADGTFSVERYRAETYLFWDKKQWCFIVIVGVAISAICAICITAFHF